MSVDSRGFYYRAVRRDGVPRKEYIGGGRVAFLIHRLEEIEREQRREARRAERMELDAERARAAQIEGPAGELLDLGRLAFRAAMYAAGFHLHKGSEWRRRCRA